MKIRKEDYTLEYIELQTALSQNVGFKIIVKTSTSKKKETYKGLTYSYMETYIEAHDDENCSIMEEYKLLRGIGEEAGEAFADSLTYMELKDWFLDKFPAIAEFHKKREEIMTKIQQKKAS